MPDATSVRSHGSAGSNSAARGHETTGPLFVGSLAFCLVFYVTGAFIFVWNAVGGETGGVFSGAATMETVLAFLGIAAAVYVVCLVALRLAVAHRQTTEDGAFADRVAHRTGAARLEALTVLAGLIAAVISLAVDWRFVPLALAVVAPAAIAAGQRTYRRPVGGSRIIFVPPGLPPMNVTPLPEVGPNEPLPEGFDLVQYKWHFAVGVNRRETFEAAVPINVGLYHEFCAMNANQGDVGLAGANAYYNRAVLGITSEIRRLAEIIRSFTMQRSYGTLDEIGIAYSFVQDEENIPYKYDSETKGQEDYWRYPLETLYERAGDCECKAIFLASLLITLGYRVVVFEIPPKPSSNVGHAALGVEAPGGVRGNFATVNGRKYFYLETTASGWQLGELPPDIDGEGITAWPLSMQS